jgi:magnesium-protoporphyrin O-methyltransferase
MEALCGNFADLEMQQETYDIVVLDRVVCCYPQWRELLEPAARRAGTAIALVYPRDDSVGRNVARMINIAHALLRHRLRFFVHPPAQMHELLRAHGFTSVHTDRHFMWDVVVVTRA